MISRLAADRRAHCRAVGAEEEAINLALQGGGAHGAFTWGVLDHLLEDGRLAIEGMSGTSAGAINAVMLADGLARGGPAEARKRLADFWRAVEHRRRPAADAAPDRRAPVHVRAARGHADAGLVRRDVALLLALRPQSPQHQSAQGSDRALRRFRGGARPYRHAAVRLRHQCDHRPAARLPAREDHRRCGDGVGRAADAVPGRRDRRRARTGTAAISAIR